MFGLLDRDIKYINEALCKFKEIEKAVIFGSRAMGNYKKGSDIDLVIIGKQITSKTVFMLNDYLNEVLPIPYFFDLIHYEKITNENLKKHIDENGKVLYER